MLVFINYSCLHIGAVRAGRETTFVVLAYLSNFVALTLVNNLKIAHS